MFSVARRHHADDRDAVGPLGVGEGDGALFHLVHLDQARVAQGVEVIVYGRRGLQTDGVADLAHGGRVAVFIHKLDQKVQNLLAFVARPCHSSASQ